MAIIRNDEAHAEVMQHAASLGEYRAFLCKKNPRFNDAKFDDLVVSLYTRLLRANDYRLQQEMSAKPAPVKAFRLDCDWLKVARNINTK